MSSFNPDAIIQLIKQGQNPQQIMMNFLESSAQSSPFGQNLLNLAKTGRTADIEQIARNYCQSHGVDFDTEFTAFRQKLGL